MASGQTARIAPLIHLPTCGVDVACRLLGGEDGRPKGLKSSARACETTHKAAVNRSSDVVRPAPDVNTGMCPDGTRRW